MKQLLLILMLLTASSSALALDEINTTYFENVAIEGCEAVAYFTEQRAVEVSKKHETNYKDANWRFASAANLAAFQADPKRYAPQYGGYCAWAVSHNDTAGIDPTQFTVHDGKSYLNCSKKISAQWKADKEAFINDTDRYWPQLLQN
jgi:YHS domain-containing protein|tara:strand:- start:3016 stop:3456 length:441 start_codon:yes stop_codon:yes gene_type:complete